MVHMEVNWHEVERICLRSFTGQSLSDQETTVLRDAHKRFPEEYITRTSAVREEERSRIRSI